MLIKAMVLVLIAAFAGLFFVNGPNGEPFMTLEDLEPSAPELKTTKAPTKVYKWQDENGVWQFSNQPRGEAQGELVELNDNINTLPAVDTWILKTDAMASSESGGGGFDIPPGLTTVSSDKVQEMMDTVNNLQQTVDDRKTQLDRMSGQP
jgi:hypothetical protein